MLSSVTDTAKRILVALYAASAVTFVAVLITPPCSDLAGADNPVYCLGGLGTQKIYLLLGLLWIGISLVLNWRDATGFP